MNAASLILALLAAPAPAPPTAAPVPAGAPAPAKAGANPSAPAPSPPDRLPSAPPSEADAGAEDSPPARSGEVTHYSFTGLGIDGELRTPALLQFLSRIGGEFETSGVPHRSFMPELQRTRLTEDVL